MKRRPRIALIVMPWLAPENPPLGVATLKSYLGSRGVDADCFYFNLLMARRVGLPLMSAMRDKVWPGWFFGYHLFGPGGTGELSDGLDDVMEDADFRRFMSETPGATPGRLKALLREDVPAFLKDCLAAAAWEDYDLIGFSSIMCSHLPCLSLAKALKARLPATPIAFGGPNVEGPMGRETIRACEWVDYVIDGEGELALAALVENVAAGRPEAPVPRVLSRTGAPAPASGAPFPMDELPTPDHRDYFEQLERHVPQADRWLRREATFEASRGCWWGQKQHCTFCGIPGAVLTFRTKSADLVFRDVVELHRKHRVRRLVATDDILALDQLGTLMPRLGQARREHRLDWEIFFETKANLKEDQIKALADAGVAEIQPGIETLSTPILKLMRKGSKAIQNLQTLKFGRTHGLFVNWVWIYGFPGEDPGEYERMAQLVPALVHLPPPTLIGRIRVDRFSPYHEAPESFGISISPFTAYRRCFPETRFSIPDIAYYFDYKPPSGRPAPDDYAAPAIAAAQLWERRHRSSFLAYQRGVGFTELFDCRPAGLRNPSAEFRRDTLIGLDSLLLKLCEGIRTLSGIWEECRVSQPKTTRRQVERALERLVDRRWLLREDDSYLSLALPMGALLPSQRVALDSLLQTQKEILLQRASAR